MKILVFEYITGGGFNKQELPDSLVREGRLMLQALLDNLAVINDIEAIVMLDWRIDGLVNTQGAASAIIGAEHDTTTEFSRLAEQCDATWPIAPEFDNILQILCQTIQSLDKKLLTSPANVVAITGNKFSTYQHLRQHRIATVSTRILTNGADIVDLNYANQNANLHEWIIKPVDGAGCNDSHIITGTQNLELISLRSDNYIVQPHLDGRKTSLSCLFKEGQGWLLCTNFQQFNVINSQYQLSSIIVNDQPVTTAYQDLVDRIARALPQLWGYVGIDLIETTEQTLVLEINPRLTTSFVGIYAATGINVCRCVLQLLSGEPDMTTTCNQPITITT